MLEDLLRGLGLGHEATLIVCSPMARPATVASEMRIGACGHSVWLTPSGKEIQERKQGHLICSYCFLLAALDDQEIAKKTEWNPEGGAE